jgi:hypothetical protein
MENGARRFIRIQPKRKEIAFHSCGDIRISISRWSSYCMRMSVTNVDPAMNGIKGHIVLQSGWK